MISCHSKQQTSVLQLPELWASSNREIKDPSVVHTPDGKYHLYGSIGNSLTQQWNVGHFISDTPYGPWTELEPVQFDGIWGNELCAPAVAYCTTRKDPWVMYIQTSCFSEDGIIVKATSTDGSHFCGSMQPVLHKQTIENTSLPVIGVYDAGVSDFSINDENYECLLISGYRKIGCGDLYISYRKAQDHEGQWPMAKLLMAQEDLPFHNSPTYAHYEWGLEGAKIIALSPSLYLLVGVCFKPLPPEYQGSRQRVFFALSRSMTGPFHPWCLPIEGMPGITMGEHGHPDILVEDNTVWLYYQHRFGEGKPWYVRVAHFDLPTLHDEAHEFLKTTTVDPSSIKQNHPEIPLISVPA